MTSPDQHEAKTDRSNVPEWSHVAITLSAVLWPSFLLAGVATMVFFAFVDPHELNLISFPEIEFSRELGYSLGFFLIWLVSASSSYLTSVLLDRSRRR